MLRHIEKLNGVNREAGDKLTPECTPVKGRAKMMREAKV